MNTTILKKQISFTPLEALFTALLLALFNVLLSTQFVFGSFFLAPMVLIFGGQILSRSLKDIGPWTGVAMALALVILQDLGLSFLYAAPHDRLLDLWIKLAQVIGLFPLSGMLLSRIKRYHPNDRRNSFLASLAYVGILSVYYLVFISFFI